ncbi:Malate dehydrogenase 2 [Durusdinium trenchii]|uniref:Mitochondrial n=1 Tax=Durusdinium trenchii TaxID=1381693 RepID=A0ABP0KZW2_9DINO
MSSASKSEGDATSAAEPASHSQPSGSDSLGPQAPPMEDRRRPQKRKAPDDSEANDQLVPLRSTGDAVVPVRRARGKQKVEMLAVPSKKLKRPRGVGAGNKKAKGKKKMVSIYEKEMIFQSFERAKDAGFKVPIKEVERESLPGYFKGCLMESKWGAVRRQQQWNLLVKTCPLLCKKAKELPNSLRRLLHLKLKVSIPHQLSSSKYQHVPFPLQQAIEEMIMDRLVLGEEVTLTLIKNTMSFAIGIFNEVVETMRHNFSTMTLETLKSQDDRLATCSQQELSEVFDDLSERAQSFFNALKKAERLANMFGVRPKKNEKPGAHLPFTHNALEAVRTYVNVTCKGKGVHPRLIANFDQVWCTLHRPAKSVRQKDPTWRGLTKDPMARSLQMRRVRHHLENALNLRFTEPNPDCKDAHQRSSMPEVSGGATATAPVDAWRTPRTLTTLSFIDGYVARGYITVKAGGISEANRELLNQSLSKYLYIEDPQEGTHIWNEKSLIRYLSGFGAVAGPNDGWHQAYHSLAASYNRVAIGFGSELQLRKQLDQLSDLSKAESALQRSRGSMKSVLELKEVPEIDGEDTDGSYEHMRIQELEGEKSFLWAIQKGDDTTTRMILPSWMADVLQMRVCKFVTEHDQWQGRMAKRGAMGKELTASQKKKFDQWSLDLKQKVIFNKSKKRVVLQASEVTKDCICVQLHLSEDPEKLLLCASSGAPYRLVLLKSEGRAESKTVPSELDHAVPPDALQELRDEAGNASEQSDEEENAEMEDLKLRELENEAYCNEFGVSDPDDLLVMADSDEEDVDVSWAGEGAKKTKTFMFRPAWVKAESLGLTQLPRHIQGCSIACHGTGRQWQGHYPLARVGLSSNWGGSTGRSECEALVKAIRGVLEAHVAAYPRDRLWLQQLQRVKDAQATQNLA